MYVRFKRYAELATQLVRTVEEALPEEEVEEVEPCANATVQQLLHLLTMPFIHDMTTQVSSSDIK